MRRATFLSHQRSCHILPHCLTMCTLVFCFLLATQHSSQHWRSLIMVSSSRQFPPQLQMVEDTRDYSGEHEAIDLEPNGCSFYRSLARQMQGDPKFFWGARDAVLNHYIRVFIDQDRQDTLYTRYTAFNQRFLARHGTFFPALASPDPFIARPPKETDGDLLLVICNTFNICVCIWDDNYIMLR